MDVYIKNLKKDASEERDKARKTVEAVLQVFRFISLFTEVDHIKIIKKIYFCRENIVKVGVRGAARKVFVQERTLLFYREKYCEVIEVLLDEIWNN